MREETSSFSQTRSNHAESCGGFSLRRCNQHSNEPLSVAQASEGVDTKWALRRMLAEQQSFGADVFGLAPAPRIIQAPQDLGSSRRGVLRILRSAGALGTAIGAMLVETLVVRVRTLAEVTTTEFVPFNSQ